MQRGLVAISAVLLTTSCPKREHSPTGVVEAFLTARAAGDEQALLSQVQQADREFLEKIGGTKKGGRFFSLAEGDSWSIGRERPDGERVLVSVAIDRNGAQSERTLTLVRENGTWKIDLVPDEVRQSIESLTTPRSNAGKARVGKPPGTAHGGTGL